MVPHKQGNYLDKTKIIIIVFGYVAIFLAMYLKESPIQTNFKLLSREIA